MGAFGSSPRERGTRWSRSASARAARFIPAGAGNASVRPLCPIPCPVHPRGSGERQAPTWDEAARNGSSPRERGTRSRAPRTGGSHGFIPAGAGNADRVHLGVVGRRVHPRGSGERVPAPSEMTLAGGSSPRERGTRRSRRGLPGRRRFIPAGAGNAAWRLRPAVICSVHPRGSGERGDHPDSPGGYIGSSPRERGTRGHQLDPDSNHRFIPAGAGNAVIACSVMVLEPVHPRGSGERETPHDRRHRPHRFIPAGAGNAWRVCRRRGELAVHPRGSGERPTEAVATLWQGGSSPRERGTRRARGPYPRRVRFIPAGAGNAMEKRRC